MKDLEELLREIERVAGGCLLCGFCEPRCQP